MINGVITKSFSSGRRLRNSRGFTLAEILIAIGILLVGMTGVLAVYAVAVDFHRRAVDNSSIALLAENMLNEITADFGRRDADFDGEETFGESFVELACRYKRFDADGNLDFGEGVAAPNMRGFNVEVSIYPLPRDVWGDASYEEELDAFFAEYYHQRHRSRQGDRCIRDDSGAEGCGLDVLDFVGRGRKLATGTNGVNLSAWLWNAAVLLAPKVRRMKAQPRVKGVARTAGWGSDAKRKLSPVGAS